MSALLDFIATPLNGVTIIQRKPHRDERGYFERMFCSAEFTMEKIQFPIVQINHTLTKQRGALRGLHFQNPPHAEDKIVSCLRGKVFDVAVDLRRSSLTFLRWHAVELSADNNRSVLISKGFAHGFQTLTDDCELLYLHSAPFTPDAEVGVHPEDPRVKISWPVPITEMSERDRNHQMLAGDFKGLAP